MAKQNWTVGQVVKVGFIAGLKVLAKIPTPGDFAPDSYILAKGAQYYNFVPHHGITSMSKLEVLVMMEEAARLEASMEAKKIAKAEALAIEEEFQIRIIGC